MSSQTYTDGVLVEEWDDTSRTYTDYRLPLVPGENPRDYNEQENAEADQRAASVAEQANVESISSKLITVDFPNMQAILDQSNADLRSDPAQEIKDLARAVRRLTRKVESLLDGSD